MALQTLLQFKNIDSSENLNARLAGLIPKGIVKGGIVVPEPASLQIRIKGDGISPFILLAFASDGMVVRERSEEHVLPVQAGITSVVVLRAKYVESQGGTIARFEVIPLGSFENDPDPSSLIRICSVTPPAGATAVLSEHINMGFRDSIEGFTRRIVREVVGTKEDLPAVSGFPAIAEINFLSNNFALGSSITMGTTAGLVSFPIVSPVNFRVASPSVPGLSRLNPGQKEIVAVTQSPLSGIVTAVTTTPHGYIAGQYVRISGNSAAQANQLWLLVTPPTSVNFAVTDIVTDLFTSNSHGFATGLKVQVSTTGTLPSGLLPATNYFVVVMSANTFKLSDTMAHAVAGTNIIDVTTTGSGIHSIIPQADTSFFFSASLTSAWSGIGGNVVDNTTNATVVATTAPGITHSLVAGSQFTLTGTTDRTFEGLYTVASVVDAQTFIYTQAGYPTSDSGNGNIHKEGSVLPLNAVEMGESNTGTALNFETVFNASVLASDVTATAIGSSLQFVATTVGTIGNTYTLAKDEPGVIPEDQVIVLSGSTFAGGVDPNPSTTTNVDLAPGDLYVVMVGSTGTMEIWGFDGVIFRNLTSASTATLLDFHRRNQFLNEKHVTENEKAALLGSVGVPSATNRYLTQADTSTLTTDIAAALTGADNVPPSGTNRYLTEARKRGERGEVAVPTGQDYVEIPLTNGTDLWSLVVGKDNTGTDSSLAIPFFNVVFNQSLYDPIGMTDRGGPTEYAQADFSPVIVDKIYVTRLSDPLPPPFLTELNPSAVVATSGIYPRPDALLLGLPSRLWVKLNQVPDNGSATILYSKVVEERYRKPAADMLTPPQRILPAQVQDLINRTKELRFNAGIKVAGTTVTFPDNLFVASNVQEYVLKRFVGAKATTLETGFSINFETGATTGGVVDAVSLVPFTISTVNKWTKYLLLLTPQGRIQVRHIADILEKSTDIAYATAMSSISSPSLPFSDGSYVFAAVNVKSDGVSGGATIIDVTPDTVELYPYQGSNSRGYATPIVCGDGVTTGGHFTGSDAHVRALAFADDGAMILLQSGTYVGTLTIIKNDITLDGSSGAIIEAVTSSGLVVTGKRFVCRNIRFENCNIAIDLQGGADDANLIGMVYGSGVTTKIKAPSIYTFNPANVAITPTNRITLGTHSLVAGAEGVLTTLGTLPSGLNLSTTYYVVNPTSTTIQLAATHNGTPLSLFDSGVGQHSFGNGQLLGLESMSTFNTWVVSDGTSARGVGAFNSPNAIQQAHNAASAGDVITIIPGVYSHITVSKDRLQFKGQGGSEVRINGGLSNTCITVTGSYNQFDNLILENSALGVDCQIGATFNTFSPTVVFASDIQNALRFPQTDTVKHYNYHPLVSGRVTSGLAATQQNTEVTVGDGRISWGDYVGWDAINVAIAGESEGTKIRVFPGTYAAINLNRNNFIIEGSGARSIIRATAGTDDACITIVNVPPASGGAGNKVYGFYLVAENNEAEGLVTVGVKITGDDNLLEDIKFEATGANRIEPNKKYQVTSGFRNKFVPHTGAPTSYMSWTVGDGVNSFGDFNGGGGITQAINSLPTKPSGTQGSLVSAGSTATFTDPTMTFAQRDLYRYICIQAGVNAGSYRIITCNTPYTTVTIERTDGLSFTSGTNIYWYFTTGAKIWVLPGQYDTFSIPNYRSDVDIEAWGAGSDTLIVGDPTDSPLLQIDGSRCRIKGFRFVGGVPVTGVAVQINGQNNTLEDNRYDTALRYAFDTYASGNQIYDAQEAVDRTYLTVSTKVSRGDFVGNSQVVIQAALDALSSDTHLNRLVLGEGVWTLTSTINVPANVILEGSGYGTQLVGNGAFAALTLNASGKQTVKGIRFTTFSNSIVGPASGVFAYNNWLETAPINVNVTGSTTMNI